MRRRISNTCIAVIENAGVVYMAGDRRSSWGMDQAQQMPVPKIEKRGGLLIGATGSGFLCSLVVNVMPIPKIAKISPSEYMVNVFTKSIHDCLVEKGFANSTGQMKIPSDYYCEAVVVVRNEVFSVIIENIYGDDSQDGAMGHVTAEQVSLPYATGCGGQWAWGVLEEHSLLHTKLKFKPEESLRRALKIAAKFSPGCDSRIDIISTK